MNGLFAGLGILGAALSADNNEDELKALIRSLSQEEHRYLTSTLRKLARKAKEKQQSYTRQSIQSSRKENVIQFAPFDSHREITAIHQLHQYVLNHRHDKGPFTVAETKEKISTKKAMQFTLETSKYRIDRLIKRLKKQKLYSQYELQIFHLLRTQQALELGERKR
jgi:hypothetical protein